MIELKTHILLDDELEPFLVVYLYMQGLQLFVNPFLCPVRVDEPRWEYICLQCPLRRVR